MDQFLSIKSTSSIAGGVGVVSEVPVCGVVRVDEGVHIGLSGGLGGLDVVVVLLLWLLGVLVGLLLLLRDSRDSLDSLSRLPVVGVMSGGVLAVGSIGDVSPLQDPEAVHPGAVLDSDGLAALVDVAVLPDPLPPGPGLLSEHHPVLLGIGRPKPSVTGIESLFLENLCLFGINILGQTHAKEASCHNLEKTIITECTQGDEKLFCMKTDQFEHYI